MACCLASARVLSDLDSIPGRRQTGSRANETGLISRRTGNYQYNPVWGKLLDQLWVR